MRAQAGWTGCQTVGSQAPLPFRVRKLRRPLSPVSCVAQESHSSFLSGGSHGTGGVICKAPVIKTPGPARQAPLSSRLLGIPWESERNCAARGRRLTLPSRSPAYKILRELRQTPSRWESSLGRGEHRFSTGQLSSAACSGGFPRPIWRLAYLLHDVSVKTHTSCLYKRL